MKGKVVIAGGSGFIGQYLSDRFKQDGYEILIVSRQKGQVSWDDEAALVAALESSAMLINLAGKPIKSRFTEKNKKELVESRVHTTETLGKALQQCKQAPPVWMNASGAHIYGTDDHKAHTENDALDKTFFPAIMAEKWEDALFQFDLPQTRKVALRISIVLGKDGGVLQPYIQLVRFGLGGRQGSGKQKFSWIHIEDFYSILLFIAAHPNMEGPVNLCAPEITDNATLMNDLRKIMKMPIGIPAPEFGIKMGAALLGIESDLILKSLSVLPKRLLDEGYQFVYPDIDSALKNIILE